MGCSPFNNGYNVLYYGIHPSFSDATNSSALSTMLNTTLPTGSDIYFPPIGVYNFSVVTAVSNKYFNFRSNGAVINMTANTQFLDMSSTVALTGSGSRWLFDGLVFNGTGSGNAQTALYFSTKSGLFSITDCLFTNWGNTAITVSATNTASTTQVGSLGGIITGCRFYNNSKGINLLDLGEYIQIVGNQFLSNTDAIISASGNALITGNTISYNVNGLEIKTGSNPAKCIISNNHITHNSGNALNIHDTLSTQGMSIKNNNIIVGTIKIENTYGIIIEGGIINADSYTFNTNVGLEFVNIKSPNSLANTITLTGTAPVYTNCTKLDGSYAYDLDNYGATKEAWATTTDGTVTTLQTIPANASSTITVSGYVTARRTGGVSGTAEDGATYRVEFNIKNVAGTATIIGQVITVIGESQAEWDVTLIGSASNILIQVTGANNNNITWKWTTIQYIKV